MKDINFDSMPATMLLVIMVTIVVMHMRHISSNNNHILLAELIIAIHVVPLALFQLIKHSMDNIINITKVVIHKYPCHYLVDIHIVSNLKQLQP